MMNFDHWIKKLALGTAQFGLDYGISNADGKVAQEELIRILGDASNYGIDMLDTAVSYGNSETAIGKAMVETGIHFNVVSKIPVSVRPEQIPDIVKKSLSRLQREHIKAYLTHHFKLFQKRSTREVLLELKNKGLMQQVGVSVYYPQEIQWLLDRNIDFDIVQLPFNIFDRRFYPLFPLLKDRGIEIHVRSVFLQGLFFLEPDHLPPWFAGVKNHILRLRDLARESGIPLSVLLLNDVLMREEIDKVIIGVTSDAELKENLNAFTYLEHSAALRDELDTFAIKDEQILLPFNWKTT